MLAIYLFDKYFDLKNLDISLMFKHFSLKAIAVPILLLTSRVYDLTTQYHFVKYESFTKEHEKRLIFAFVRFLILVVIYFLNLKAFYELINKCVTKNKMAKMDNVSQSEDFTISLGLEKDT